LLHFDEDVSSFLTTGKDHERIGYAYKNLGGASRIIINFSAVNEGDPVGRDLLMDAADHLAGLLENGEAATHISRLTYRVDPSMMLDVSSFIIENMPFFLEEEDYLRIDSLTKPHMASQRMREVKEVLLSPSGMVLKNTLLLDPFLFSGPLLERLEGFRLGDHFAVYDDYIFSSDGKEAVMTVDSRYPTGDTGNNKKLIRALDLAIEHTEEAFGGRISAEPFGAAYIALTNATQIRKDTWLSVAIALVVIAILLALYFRNIKLILLIGIAVLAGSLFAFAMAGVMTSSLSLIAIGAGSVIVGIAVNYPLHFLSHIRDGYTPRQTLSDIVSPLTTGNLTTVGAFLSLLFLSSPAMRGFGLFASLLLLGTILFVLIFLPHMIPAKVSVSRPLKFGKLAESSPEKNRWVMWLILLLTVFLWLGNKGVVFNADMQSVNYMTAGQKEGMAKLLDRTQGSQHVMYFVAQGETLDQALERYEEALPVVTAYRRSGIGSFLPSRTMQEERIARWDAFWSTRKAAFLEHLSKVIRDNGFREGSFGRFEQILNQVYTPREPEVFEPVMTHLASGYLSQSPGRNLVYTMLHIEPEEAAEVEAELNKAGTDTFAFDMGSVTRLMISSLSSDFDYVLFICGFIVFLFLTLSFGRLELSLIAFLPLAVSWIWILGIMSLLHIEFNIVNIILATFIFGLGDDYTIFITEGMMYEYARGKKMLGTYKNTVALSALIMLAGIGSLIVAKHPAMRSLAEITIIGMVSVVITAYVLPPYFFRKLVTKRGRYREEPLTFTNLFHTVLGFSFFLAGILYLILAGSVLLVAGKKNERNKLRFHKLLQGISRYAIFHIPKTKMQLQHMETLDLSKPSVIIANHQSHLDLMAVIMLHPRIIVMTNNREWNSPFYKLILRFADFLPIEYLTTHPHLIRERTERGYSIMIFPEGTRSPDCSILRFHKGAFSLARDLGLDITPLLLHGFGHVLPKENLLFRKGCMTVSVLPRIPAGDTSFGETYQEQSRNVRRMFIREYASLSALMEDAHYVAPKVLHNYLYKGRDIFSSVRRSMQKNNNFADRIDALPLSGTCYLTDDNLGEFALSASLVRKNLEIKAYIADPEKRDLARHCASVPVNLNYTDKPETDEQ